MMALHEAKAVFKQNLLSEAAVADAVEGTSTMRVKNYYSDLTFSEANHISSNEIKETTGASEMINNNITSQQKYVDAKSFLTTDKNLLDQYYNLRHEAYRDENGWANYSGMENEYDRKGKIFVAVVDGKVVGGVRLLTSKLIDYSANEEPNSEFVYKNIFKKLGYSEDSSWAEIAALVVAKEYRNRVITTKLFQIATEEAVRTECDYMIGVAVSAVCRDDRLLFRSLGYEPTILLNFPWIKRETYNNVKMFPIIASIKKLN